MERETHGREGKAANQTTTEDKRHTDLRGGVWGRKVRAQIDTMLRKGSDKGRRSKSPNEKVEVKQRGTRCETHSGLDCGGRD